MEVPYCSKGPLKSHRLWLMFNPSLSENLYLVGMCGLRDLQGSAAQKGKARSVSAEGSEICRSQTITLASHG
jgi:hypothetical protein